METFLRQIDLPGGLHAATPERGPQVDARQKEALRRACREFEAIFIEQWLKEVRRTLPESVALPLSAGEGLYRDLADEALARALSNGKGIGLADLLYRQLAAQLAKTEAVHGETGSSGR